jgi:hypothetical protein
MRAWLYFILLPLAAMAGTNEGSILLQNDSIHILTATIVASDGSYLGQFTVQPGQQRNFTQNLNPTSYKRAGTPDITLTPYTVIWQCSSEDLYSQNTVVSPGSLVRAGLGFGPLFCRPKQHQEKQTPASTIKKTK